MTTFMTRIIFCAALLLPGSLFAQTAYTEGLINLPNGVPQAAGIDDNDQIAGSFYDSSNVSHGFIWTAGVVAQIDQPGAQSTSLTGINSKSGIVGYYSSGAASIASMLDAKRRFATVKGSSKKVVLGINTAGDFVGFDEGTGAGFINVKGTYTVIKPDLCNSLDAPVSVYVLGLNSKDDFVGVCFDQSGALSIGFANVAGAYQTVSLPGHLTYPSGINDSGTIAGYFSGTGGYHGFVMTSGVLTQFDFVGAPQTTILGINNKGSLTGLIYQSGPAQWTGFYALAN